MARDLNHVIGGVGMRFGEKGDDNFVDAVASSGIDQLAEVGSSRLKFA